MRVEAIVVARARAVGGRAREADATSPTRRLKPTRHARGEAEWGKRSIDAVALRGELGAAAEEAAAPYQARSACAGGEGVVQLVLAGGRRLDVDHHRRRRAAVALEGGTTTARQRNGSKRASGKLGAPTARRGCRRRRTRTRWRTRRWSACAANYRMT